ncbi:hypothetical protein ACFV24_03615 [Nocardia fluminea]|uniref:hypothetical protein n=1 Tax=Nocardia fluminea TaxID=134984 RepID=UPI00366D5BDF
MAHWKDLRATGGLRNPPTQIRIRNSFAKNEVPKSSGSARRLPSRADRPPAARLVTSQGSLLKFEIAILAEAQLRTGLGRVPENPRPLMGDSTTVGWSELFPLEATPTSGLRASYSDIHDLRRNQLVGNVRKLVDRGFLHVPVKDPPSPRFDAEGFLLLDEGGPPPGYAGEKYLVPKAPTGFTIPYALVESGWLFVLSEAALVMLLFAAQHYDPNSEDGIMMSEQDRIRYHGISTSTYGRAQLLDDLGLLEVTMDPTRAVLDDGTPRDKRHSRPNRIRLLPERLDDDALEVVLDYLEK